MTSPKAVSEEPEPAGTISPESGAKPLGLVSLLILSAWCGLVAGLLEVATIVIRKRLFDSIELYGMSRHFTWMIPAANLCVFLVFGVFGCVLVFAWPGRGRWLVKRVLCALALLPALLVAIPQIYNLAWVILSLGVALELVPLFERRARAFRWLVQVSLPAVLVLVVILAATPWILDRISLSREFARRLPPAGSPNVLLIVMDTVAAGHLSVHGYNRPTSKTLAELAEQGTQFRSAQAAAPWTLPSHAAMFTGHWMHELSVGWKTPLDNARLTIAEFLGASGYATAGFVANTSYCARDSGLNRGFTEYRDFVFPGLTSLKHAVLVSRALSGVQATIEFLEDEIGIAGVRADLKRLGEWFAADRKSAAMVNRELLDWLSHRPQPERPFLAFLNYFDAHYPYQVAADGYHRFGGTPADARQRAMIENWFAVDKTSLSPQELAFATRAYDDCIADLDEQLGWLIDRLRKQGRLENTWVIITADHGESFGEHAGIFCHGASLYQTELHVPLLIIPPGGRATRQVVKEAVSLRDLAATIVDVAGQKVRSPFPGQSLARFWEASLDQPGPASSDPALAEVVPNPELIPHNRDPAGVAKPIWPLGSLHDAEWSYIRREGDIREELFHLRDDANEEHNLAADPTARPTLERMRAALGTVTGGPLLPQRFRP
jgi:arylsulfatase A-like enzyme